MSGNNFVIVNMDGGSSRLKVAGHMVRKLMLFELSTL